MLQLLGYAIHRSCRTLVEDFVEETQKWTWYLYALPTSPHARLENGLTELSEQAEHLIQAIERSMSNANLTFSKRVFFTFFLISNFKFENLKL